MNPETKFTPGPWKPVPYEPGLISIRASNGVILCDLVLSLGGDEEHNEEFRANAALIAVAPKMFAMLSSLSTIFNDRNFTDRGRYGERIDALLLEATSVHSAANSATASS